MRFWEAYEVAVYGLHFPEFLSLLVRNFPTRFGFQTPRIGLFVGVTLKVKHVVTRTSLGNQIRFRGG